MKLSDDHIKDIAQDLDMGLVCYVHKASHEIKSVVDRNNDFGYDDFEEWEELLEEVESNSDKYLRFEKMSTIASFQIMEGFADKVSDRNIRNRLIHALKKNKPFRNFRHEAGINEDIRQQWFKYKAEQYQAYVKDCLNEMLDSGTGEEE